MLLLLMCDEDVLRCAKHPYFLFEKYYIKTAMRKKNVFLPIHSC